MATRKAMTCTVVLKNSLYLAGDAPEDVEYIETSPDDPTTITLARPNTITTITCTDSTGGGTRTISAIFGEKMARTEIGKFPLTVPKITVDVTRQELGASTETIVKFGQPARSFLERALSFANSQFKIKC